LEQSEAKGISPTFSKSMVKRIGVFQKFVKTKQNEVKFFTILQDRSKTNVFISNCVEEEKRKKEASFFFGKKVKKSEYNRSSSIEDLPLLVTKLITQLPLVSVLYYILPIDKSYKYNKPVDQTMLKTG
jgi:hypothetical protein